MRLVVFVGIYMARLSEYLEITFVIAIKLRVPPPPFHSTLKCESGTAQPPPSSPPPYPPPPILLVL